MKPAVKYAAMGGGALVLLFGSFVTFAALSGQPLHKVAILSMFVKAPAESEGETHKETPAEEHPAAKGDKPAEGEKHVAEGEKHAPPGPEEAKAVEKSIGVLGAFSLPAPFSSDELTDLQHELSSGNRDLKSRLKKVEQRERDLDERERDLEERQKELDALRKKLAEKQNELEMLSGEVQRDEKARGQRESASWKAISKFFEEGEPADMAKKLAAYEPAEAARILRSLDDERASALVNALPTDKYKDYLEAYRAETAKDAKSKRP